jgi:hypothetical protein
MSYTAKDYFPDWYKVIEPKPDQEIINSRIAAIEKIITNKNKEFWLDVIRMHLGLIPKNSENKEKFIAEFRSTDGSFPITESDNQNLVKVLASIVLCFKLEIEDKNLNFLISLAAINSNFLNQYNITSKIPVLDKALNYSLHYTREERECDFENELDEMDEIVNDKEELDKDQINTMAQIIRSQIQAYKNLSEETNVLWWIFGEYSKICGDYFKNVGNFKMIIAGAKELSDIAEYSNGFQSAQPILHKALEKSENKKTDLKEISAFEVINTLTEDLKKKVINGSQDLISEFTPCLLALLKSIDFNKGEDWSNIYSKSSNGGDIKKKFKQDELSYQFYKELSFIKLLN